MAENDGAQYLEVTSKGITTAISLLESALRMHDVEDVRQNVVLARSTLFDLLAASDDKNA